MKKKCFKCNKIKGINDFYKHAGMKDGHLGKCKECTKKDTKINYIQNHDYYVAYDRERAKLPKRIEARKQYIKNNPEIKKKANDNYIKKYPQKHKAKRILNRAVKNKNIFKPVLCGNFLFSDVCSDKLEAHHEDYNKPLEVIWLCVKCHKELHNKKRINNAN